jgi:hypothetical protein
MTPASTGPSGQPQFWAVPAAAALLLAVIAVALMPAATCELHLYEGSGLVVLVLGALAVALASVAASVGFRHHRAQSGRVSTGETATAVVIGILAALVVAFVLVAAWGLIVLGAPSC